MSLSKRFLTVAEYARFKGVTTQRVRQLLAEGRISGERIGGRWLILREEEPPALDQTYRLTFFSHAGGVGKTTLARDIGYYLARMGYRTLLIDTDPQANLTAWLGVGRVKDEQTLLALVRTGELPSPISGLFDLPLDLVPASLNLALMDLEIGKTPGGDMALRRVLGKLSGYGFVLIDSPPYISQTTTMAGLAGEGFIVPIEVSAKGLESLSGLTALAQTFARALERDPVEWIRLLVPTKYDPRTGVDREVMDELNILSGKGYQIAPPMAYRPGPHKRASLEGKPIPTLYPLSEAAKEVEAVTKTLLQRLLGVKT